MSKFILGDCMDPETGIPSYPDNYFDLAIVDPPYGIGYSEIVSKKLVKHGWKNRKLSKWDNAPPNKEYFYELFRVSKNQMIWGGNYFNLPVTRCFLIWDKVQRIDQADCEFCWTSFEKSARVFRYARGNESGFAPKLSGAERAGINIHPTQKPIKLYRWLLANYAKPGDLILDTHVGSASSLIAYEQEGFEYVGYELDPDYYAAATKRMKQVLSQTRLF